MNRYKSSQRWRKVEAGVYESPDRHYRAWRINDGRWRLVSSDLPMFQITAEGEWRQLNVFLTLADCQEHAERLERSQRAAWWGFREGAKKANDASV